ncbi:hypothetical protein FRC10_010764 [Ceratobasidium sp. 414]|nr:hypothetical protein FRC10_010764 [Ceratobasidium sp. 414]
MGRTRNLDRRQCGEHRFRRLCAWNGTKFALEAITGQAPYHDKRDTVVMHLVLFMKAIPERPKQVIDDILWKLLEKMWSYAPVDRPGAGLSIDRFIIDGAK